jgi:Domain of unknown function (DUF1833)
MSRSLSLRALAALYAQETGEVVVYLATISHPALANPIRVSSDYLPGGAPTVSRGNSFAFYPFDAAFPTDRSDQPPKAKIIFDNIDRAVTAAIRSIPAAQLPNTPPSLLLEIVLASTPDVVEVSFDFQMLTVEYDALTITAELGFELYLQESFPGDLFTPGNTPGVFD